jgi:FkbM family methyltransferase
MNRRTFFPWLTGGVSGSYLLGAIGGVGLGASGATLGTTALRPWSRQSHSQQGEDLIVQSIFEVLEIRQPTYLDIGAADPCRDNNTFLFYQQGCRGVLVEPNPAYCRKIRFQRPRDTVLNAGVGVSSQTEADYFMVGGRDGDYLNSFSKTQIDDIIARSDGMRYIAKVLKMPLININQLIETHLQKAPSFLSIDVEGLDLSILQTLDFQRFRPAIFCVETIAIGTTRIETEILDLLKSKGYSIRGGTFVNTIFVDNQLLL